MGMVMDFIKSLLEETPTYTAGGTPYGGLGERRDK
jgi:hypothetical protein